MRKKNSKPKPKPKPEGQKEETRSASELVEDMTRECRLDGSGTFPFKPPTFLGLSYCIFCQMGCTCIGICCQGRKKAPIKSTFRNTASPKSVAIPGLEFTSTFTSLVSLREEHEKESSKRPIAAFSTNSDIYKWSHLQSKTVKSHQNSSTTNVTNSNKRNQTKNTSISTQNHSSLGSTKTRPSQARRQARKQARKQARRKARRQGRRQVGKQVGNKTSQVKSSKHLAVSKSSPSGRFMRQIVSEVSCKKKSVSINTSLYPSKAAQPSPLSQNPSHPPHSNIQFLPLSFHSSLEDFEVLRSSPPHHHKRRQCESPPSSHVTPTKNTLGKQRSKGHTPRKDTPKKTKRQRFQCRNLGCKDFLASTAIRDRHEDRYCRRRPGVQPEVSMSTEFDVPSHAQLDLDPLQCRIRKSLNE